MKTVFLDAGDFISDDKLIEPLRALGEVVIYPGIPESEEEALERMKGADIVAFCLMQISNEMLDKLTDLKILQFIGTGVGTFVDMDYAKSKGIKVLKIEGYGNNAVAEFGIACAFAAARQIGLGDKLLRRGGWVNSECEGMEISGSRFGVAGTGNIGWLVAQKAALLGADVYAFDLYENDELKEKYNVKYVSLKELFSTCDIVSLHLKVNKETTGIVSREMIESMKKGSVLVNVARAELVDEDALYDALTEKRLMSAAVDVFTEEPPANCRLLELDNVITTPHIGFYSKKASDNSIIMSVDSILSEIE